MRLIKSNIYKWHRSCSLIIAIPVLLWAASGFMHPLMTNIRPKIATQGLSPIPVDSGKIRIPLQAALRLHHLDSISNFRLVHIDTNWFYQVLPATHRVSVNAGPSNKAGHPNRDAGLNNPRSSRNDSGITNADHSGSDAGLNNPGHSDGSSGVTHPSGSNNHADLNNSSDFPLVNATNIPIYLSCLNGNVLPAGDWLYAQYLARQFLEGPAPAPNPASSSHPAALQPDTPTNHPLASTAHPHSPPPPASLSIAYTPPSAQDCCGAATDCVLNPAKGTKVANVSLIKDYDPEYKSINKLLPVYRVSFDRPDGIRIYVETTRDRFAFAMDNRRFLFDRIFTLIHTWAWLDFLGKGKLVVEFCLVFMAFLTTLMGIYIFFTTKSKKARGNKVAGARRTHRFTAITIALFTLLFTFSGAFHALSKFREDTRDRFFVSPFFAATDLNFNFIQLQQVVRSPITDIHIVSMGHRNYWQITTLATSSAAGPSSSPSSSSSQSSPLQSSSSSLPTSSSSQSSPSQLSSSSAPSSSQAAPEASSLKEAPAAGQSTRIMSNPATHSRDLMKDPQAGMASVTYIQIDSPYSILPEGEQKYAGFLAAVFSGQPIENSQPPVPILRFSSEYNFADKRLPVWKISYPTHDNERYYVETSTGRLSKRVTDNSMIEEYSFAFFHKHEFMAWGGRGLKDFSTMFWALAQIAMVVIGLILYYRLLSRKKSSDKKSPNELRKA